MASERRELMQRPHQELLFEANKIGLTEMTDTQVLDRKNALSKQVKIGLNRVGSPTTTDNGILAIRTGIPSLSTETWNRVPQGRQTFVADIAGTNWNVMTATKNETDGIDLQTSSKKSYDVPERKIPYQKFIDRIAFPIAGEVLASGNEEPVDIGIALGFAHENEVTQNGIEAKLINVGDDGSLVKEWQITDWDPKTMGNVTKDVKKKLKELHVRVGTVVAINDTPSVALDREAIKDAQDTYGHVLPVGVVGGTGTNAAIDRDGLINLEIGDAAWETNEVFENMQKDKLISNGTPVMELETGGMYLAKRLAVGMELLGGKKKTHFTPNPELIDNLKRAPEDEAGKFVSDLASGLRPTDEATRLLAQGVLKRAGQVFGIMAATIAEATPQEPSANPYKPQAILAEGSVIHKGFGVKVNAEVTAEALGRPIRFVEARGLRGIAALTMSYSELSQAA